MTIQAKSHHSQNHKVQNQQMLHVKHNCFSLHAMQNNSDCSFWRIELDDQESNFDKKGFVGMWCITEWQHFWGQMKWEVRRFVVSLLFSVSSCLISMLKIHKTLYLEWGNNITVMMNVVMINFSVRTHRHTCKKNP